MTNAGTITYTGTLVVVDCYKCAIMFAVPRDFDRENRDTGRAFYCPNGHGQVYSQSEVAKLRKQIAREKEWREQADARADAAWDQARAADRSAAAYKGQVTKIRKRVANGVCPCCNRTFVNMARHMETKHPDYEPRPAAPS